MFGSVLDKVGALLSGSFILANFFPFLIFAAANLGMTWIVFPDSRQYIKSMFLAQSSGEQAMIYATTLIAIAVIAYVLSPLAVVFRQLLEGAFLPARFKRRLRSEQLGESNKLAKEIDVASALDSLIEKWADITIACLQDANRKGANASAQNSQQIESVISKVDETIQNRQPVSEATITAMAPLVSELQTILSNTSHVKTPLRDRLSSSQLDLTRLIRGFSDEARYALADAIEAKRSQFAIRSLSATRLANIRAATEGYSWDTYGIEFDYLWPRLRLLLHKNDKFAAPLEAAKTQIDFSLLMVALSCVFAIEWLSLAFAYGSPYVLIAVATGGPLVVLAFKRIVEESMKQFGALVASAVDLTRFTLLKELNFSVPGDSAAERKLWERIQKLATAHGTIDVQYSRGNS